MIELIRMQTPIGFNSIRLEALFRNFELIRGEKRTKLLSQDYYFKR